MNYFNEKYLCTLDHKARLLLPLDIRQQFKVRRSDILYLIPNTSDPEYLEIRTISQWQSYQQKLLEQEPNVQKKDFLRYTMMLHERVAIDGQGRVVISERLRKLCKLDGTVAVINMQTYVEVWNTAHMERRYADLVRAYRELSDRLF
jgi:division/cell wall cluster transcriptional repressor MraZ